MLIRYRETFAACWSALEKRLLPSYVWTSDPLTFWRERILFLICFIASVFGPIALIPSLLLSYKEGLWGVILIDSLAYVVAVTILIARNASFVVRALGFCSILYALGISILFILGPVGAGYIWLFGASVLISTFFGLGAAVWTLVVNAIALLSVGVFIAYGNPEWALHVENALEKWLVMATNFLLLNAFVTITTAFLLNGLKGALLAEQKISRNLRESEELFRSYLEYAPDGVYLSDLEGNFLYGNRKCEEIIGHRREELIGKNFLELNILPEQSLNKAAQLLQANIEGKSTGPDEIELINKEAGLISVEINTSVVQRMGQRIVLAFVRDTTERKKAADKIHLLHYYDSLTGLPNRTFHKELMERSIEHARRRKEIFALIHIGLDNFQRINDTLGHSIGDLLLKAVADRLTNSLRKSDYVARSDEGETVNVVSRVGGDEFIVLAHDLKQLQGAAIASRRLLKEISAPYDLSGREVFMTASIGIALYPDDGTDVDDLLKNAEKAMRHTKSEGKNSYQFYSGSMNSFVLELLTLESDLHKALERDELVLYYQPKVDAATRTVKGMEALIRWKHPDKGLIPPMQFIPLAETSGLIIPIGEFVIRTVCGQIKTWQDAGYKQTNIALNVSGRQFDQQNLIEIFKDALQDAVISPQRLVLEITESTIMRNPEKAIRTLTELKAIGVQIAIDDFGTGYSSLSYLKRLLPDFLKIDQSFVKGLASDPSDQAIVRATIAMAHSLNLKTVAEGVETEEQLSFLQEHGCDEIQGYLFSRPLPAEEIPGILAKGYL